MRYATSGANATVIAYASDAPNHLLGKAIAAGRVFWLRNAWFYNTDFKRVIDILNQATTAATAAPANKRTLIDCASGRTTMVEFPAPGLKFSTACTVVLDGTADGTATSNFLIGYIGGAGYEE